MTRDERLSWELTRILEENPEFRAFVNSAENDGPDDEDACAASAGPSHRGGKTLPPPPAPDFSAEKTSHSSDRKRVA